MNKDKIASRLQNLFVNRNDVYARQFLINQKKAFKLISEPLSLERILQHLEGRDFLGVYQLSRENEVKWGCLDFDLNTPQDYETAKQIYNFLKNKGFHPLLEKSGGGDYKVHIWIFSNPIPAKQMRFFLENICQESGLKPHEIFPKQDAIKEDEYGNLVKLPLGKHLETKAFSIFLDEQFNPVEPEKILEYHFDNRDIIPEPKEEISKSLKIEETNPSEFDEFFNFVLKNPLPEGVSKDIKIGTREAGINNNILKNLGIWFARKGYSEKDLEEKIKPIYKERGWVFGDLKGWFKKAQKGEMTISKGELIKWATSYSPNLLKFLIDGDAFLTIKYNKKGEEIGREVNIDKISEYVQDKFQIRTIYGTKEETIEVYRGGIWVTKGRGIIKAEVERLLGIYARNHVVNEILEKIKRRTETSREETEIVPNSRRCLRNGVLDFEDIENIKLIPHSKEYNFRTKWDIDYNPKTKSKKFLSVVEKALYPEDLQKFQEWNGLHLVRRYIKKKFAIYYGEKDTSKTLLMNHLTIALNNNVSGLSIQDIARGKPFDLLVLKDKDANICDELSSSDMKATGGVKKSVGEGFIDAEMKFGDKLRFPNTAKQTYACNKIPNPQEDIDDEAYYGRIILFAFENIIPEKEQDEDLINKITTDEELSGWLNWAIEGYKRLKKQNSFTNDKTPEETKFLMIKGGNSLAEFSSEVLEQKEGATITKEDLYKVYCKWCLDHKPKLSPDSKEKIGRNLIRFNPYVSSEKSGSERYWLNLKLRDTWDTFLKNMSDYGESDKKEKNKNKNVNQKNIYIFSNSVPSVPISKEESLEEIADRLRTAYANGEMSKEEIESELDKIKEAQIK